MDFVPLASFEFLNSLLQGVEAQGCLMTVRLEAFTCRSTRKKKQLAASMAHYANANTPPLAPASHAGLSPPPLQLDRRLPVVFAPVDPEDIDDRLVYLVAALNSIYGEDGYDFSVLTEEDFVVCNEAQVRAEVDVTLHSMSDSCRPAVEQFWTLVSEQVMDASPGCEYFRFMCPTCDPMVSRSLFSQHYFLYIGGVGCLCLYSYLPRATRTAATMVLLWGMVFTWNVTMQTRMRETTVAGGRGKAAPSHYRRTTV
ncbi:hypothetical protein, conserved [Trypanosoma cruzi]|uniref:Uncharacterized protein n=1 Tax=Trypanosoma cruzi (strain CL Brener) TaxID=353153 RepID=Q4DJP8_TRYCC|nr:hypothetical protein, conserved [Trypanosoma cruzi]EAN92753.1 hypothetical protein, conserved [Trypanosoma cruzi]|eukprot:XP_814604.1 hypothetical protein [Trypanosoma cruzi strain CL Brener]